MKIDDNFLPEELFKQLQYHCSKHDFRIVEVGAKLFSILETPLEIIDLIQEKEHDLILTFIREAHDGFDNDFRIHADGIINGKKCDVAKVFYINNLEGVTENGTAFWKHHIHGVELPKDVTNEEFDRLLTEDANNLDLWEQIDFVAAKPNRMLTYKSNNFHSKYPSNIKEGIRIVLVAFYSKKQ